MSRRNVVNSHKKPFFCRWLAVGSLALVAMVGAQAQAQQPLDRQIQAHLAAGEFGPARAAAMRAPAGAERDRLLRQVATAQAAVGARNAGLDTASSIADDRIRGSALGAIGNGPLAARRGGGVQADFDSLTDLIQTLVKPQSWEKAGGPGNIQAFPGGVYIDAQGQLKRLTVAKNAPLASVRQAASANSGNRDVTKASGLRKVSLTRLEKQAQLLWAAGRDPSEAMQNLAGLTEIKYVLVYPEQGDIVLAGPAGPWRTNNHGRVVNARSGKPVLQLDDLVVLLRNAQTNTGQFGCSIEPRAANLSSTHKYLTENGNQTFRSAAARDRWHEGLKKALGLQDIRVFGIDPQSRVAQVMVEADHHMKLIGTGLADGTMGVPSYLEMLAQQKNGAAQPGSILRWWFTMNYSGIKTTPARDAFSFDGQAVQLLSENQFYDAQGRRTRTGKSDDLNREFARNFTKNYPRLADKYPVYAELRNVFDLALVAALIQSQDLANQVDWHMTHFGSSEGYQVARGYAPKAVQSVVNYKVTRGGAVLTCASGGVSIDPSGLVTTKAIKIDTYGKMKADRATARPENLAADAWWWD